MRKGNICKRKAKWHLDLNASKSENMRRYFEASSIIKYEKDKGNKYVYNIYVYKWS